MSEKIEIDFYYQLEGTSKQIHLYAEAETHSETSFQISNIKTSGGARILPGLSIKKVKGSWVHIDSGQKTYLSQAIGSAIESALTSHS